MKKNQLDELVTELGRLQLMDPESFEEKASKTALLLDKKDIQYLISILHCPPDLPKEIKELDLPLGQWMAICQYSCFELICNLGNEMIGFLKKVAFGKYDWTQATALEVICRMYIDGKVTDEIIEEINKELPAMRYETHLYFASALLLRSEKDPKYNQLIDQFQNEEFREALTELKNN
jgi:hypothetical protein